MNSYTIYLGTVAIAYVQGTEYAYSVYKKTAELADLLGDTAFLTDGETGEVLASSDDEE